MNYTIDKLVYIFVNPFSRELFGKKKCLVVFLRCLATNEVLLRTNAM